jgi:hypothetical protein
MEHGLGLITAASQIRNGCAGKNIMIMLQDKMGLLTGLTNIGRVCRRVRIAADEMQGLFRLRTRSSCLHLPVVVAWFKADLAMPGALTRAWRRSLRQLDNE